LAAGSFFLLKALQTFTEFSVDMENVPDARVVSFDLGIA
jgi:hypothetical protein